MEKMIDGFERKITYLRISVTDRCNIRCIYCMPEYGIYPKPASEILSFEEIAQVVRLAIGLGINKIKITGGEPLVRRDLPKLIYLLSSLDGLEDLSLTTNGILLQRYAKALKEAGLKRINISLDTLDSQKFEEITRTDSLKDVLEGIDTALKEKFFVKLNIVVLKGLNDNEILNFVRFAEEKQIIIRFIELMPFRRGLSQDMYISCTAIKEKLAVLGLLEAIPDKLGNGPARYYKIKGTSVIVGFISPLSGKFCSTCSRLRMTSDGLLIPCLANDKGLDLKKPLRKNKKEEILDLLRKAIFLKPKEHNLNFFNYQECLMSKIGG